MEYNTSLPDLRLPEYGRTIQNLVEHCKSLPTQEERTQMAQDIIDFMAIRNPQMREEEQYQRKLWDHLYILSNFELDIVSPYPVPKKEDLFSRSERMPYPQNHIKYRFYGTNILNLIKQVTDAEDGEEKEKLILSIANIMKKAYLNYNRDHVSDDIILEHLAELSEGKLDLSGIDNLERSRPQNQQRRAQNHRQVGQKSNTPPPHRKNFYPKKRTR